MPTVTATLMYERDELRNADPTNPRIQQLNQDINHSIKQHRQDKWLETLNNCPAGSKRLWDTIRNLAKPSMKTECRVQRDPLKIANKLSTQYTRVRKASQDLQNAATQHDKEDRRYPNQHNTRPGYSCHLTGQGHGVSPPCSITSATLEYSFWPTCITTTLKTQ